MLFARCITLPEEEKRQLLGWGSDVFNTEDLNLIWRPKQLQLVLYRDNKAVSTCGLLKQSVQVADQTLQVGGIGGLVTPPGLQGKGFASQVLRQCLRIFADEWTLDAAMLFCREDLVPFYGARSWLELGAPVSILQPSGMMPCPTPVMVYPLAMPWPPGPVSIDSLPW